MALITDEDDRLTDLALCLLKTAKHHDAPPLSLRPTVPGIGKVLRLVLLDEIPQIERFPSVQEFASSCRVVPCRKEPGGKRLGPSGHKIGTAHRPWALSEAATLFLRNHPQGQKLRSRLEQPHAQGNALSLRAHTLGRAVYFRLPRQGAFDRERCLQTSGSRAGEPGASLDIKGRSLSQARLRCQLNGVCARQGVHRPQVPAPDALSGHPRWLLTRRRGSPSVAWAAPLPNPARTGESISRSQACA